MDDLAASLATSFSVSNDPNTTAAEHPRFSQYKNKKSGSDQEARRKNMLTNQKSRRFDAVAHIRRLGDNSWADMKEEEEEDMDVEVSKHRPGRFYKNQLMFSEWLVEVPENFEDDWLLVPCPVGRRNLIVASRGQTACYTKSGFCMGKFPSHLPGGNRQQRGKEKSTTAILDCVYSELTRTYYVLDIMCWKDNPVFDSESDFRFYWLHTKLQEVPELTTVSKTNPYRFEALPNFRCDRANIENVLSTPMNVELDGLLFYHRCTHYTFGPTPLVGWLKAYMLPDILGIPIPERLSAQKPRTYTTFENHVSEVQKGKEQKASGDKKSGPLPRVLSSSTGQEGTAKSPKAAAGTGSKGKGQKDGAGRGMQQLPQYQQQQRQKRSPQGAGSGRPIVGTTSGVNEMLENPWNSYR